MTREDFLSELTAELEAVDTNEVNDVLLYYNEYFDDAQDEQKAIDELGSPKKIATQILITATTKKVNADSADNDDSNGDDGTSFDGVENIDIDVIACDVHFIRSNKNTVSYQLNNSETLLVCEVDKKTKTLVFKTKAAQFMNSFPFNFNLNSNFNSSQTYVDIYYKDSDFFENITVKTVSGDMDFEDINAKQMRLNSVAGDCQGRKLVTQNLFFETKSGDCNIDEIDSAENNFLSLNSISGDFAIERLKADNAKIHSVSGDLNFRSVLTKQLDIDTVSGDIFVYGTLVGTNNLKTVSGDIKATTSLLQNDYNFNVSTVSGDTSPIKGRFFNDKENSINAKTVSGDISLNFGR